MVGVNFDFPLSALCLTSDGKHLVVGCEDGLVSVLTTKSGEVLNTVNLNVAIRSLAVDHNLHFSTHSISLQRELEEQARRTHTKWWL